MFANIILSCSQILMCYKYLFYDKNWLKAERSITALQILKEIVHFSVYQIPLK